MKKIYLVQVIEDDGLGFSIKKQIAFNKESDANFIRDNYNNFIKEQLPLDLFCDAEMYFENDLKDIINSSPSFIEYGDNFLAEHTNPLYYSSIEESWKYIKNLYNKSKTKDFDTFCMDNMYKYNGDRTENYEKFLTHIIHFFCSDLHKYTYTQIYNAVILYNRNWSKLEAIVKEVDLYEDTIDQASNAWKNYLNLYE